MRRIDLQRSKHCCCSPAQDRPAAQALRAAISRAQPRRDSPVVALQTLLSVPIGATALESLRRQPLHVLKRDVVISLLTEFRRRPILFVNPFLGIVTEPALQRFRHLHTAPEMHRLLSDLAARAAFPNLTWRRFTELWEAGLGALTASLPISIGASRFAAAMPAIIDFQTDEIPIVRPGTRRTPPQDVDALDSLKREFSRRLRGKQDQAARGHTPQSMLSLFHDAAQEANRHGDLWLAAAIQSVSTTVDQCEKKPAPSSIIRIMASAKRLYRMAHSGTLEGSIASRELRVTSWDAKVYREFRKVAIEQGAKINGLPESIRRTRHPPREYALIHPSLYAACYGLGDAPANPGENIQRAALRILGCILYHTGRRAVCLTDLTPSAFSIHREQTTGRVLASIRIPSSKTSAENRTPSPIDLLWPEDEIAHLVDFLELPQVRLSRKRRIIDFAGFGNLTRRNKDLVQQRVANALLASGLDTIQRSTHLARTTWATWWPIRVLCCRYPFLLDEVKWLQSVRNHPWFSATALAKLRKLVGDRFVDSLNIGRQIAGHGSPGQFIHTYCRSWPLVMHLQSFILWRQGRCPLRPSDPIL